MIIECSHCHAKYQYDEAKFEGKPSKKIRCAKCQQVFEISNPNRDLAAAAAPPPEPQSGAARPAAPEPPKPRPSVDSTMTRPPRPKTLSGVPIPAGTAERKLDAGVINQDVNPPITGDKRFSLAIIDGPDAGTVFRVERARTIIGRSGADFALNDSEASRNHAVVDVRGGMVLLEDLGSTNGTLFAGERISGPVDLQNHSEFQIGSTTLMLIITEVE